MHIVPSVGRFKSLLKTLITTAHSRGLITKRWTAVLIIALALEAA